MLLFEIATQGATPYGTMPMPDVIAMLNEGKPVTANRLAGLWDRWPSAWADFQHRPLFAVPGERLRLPEWSPAAFVT